MNIQETIARFNSLHKAERGALDTLGNDPSTIDSYLKTAGESNRFFAENWPLISAELKRLQSALDLANAGFEGCDNLCAQQRAAIEKAREALNQLARLGAGDRYGNSEGNRIAQEALTALDGLASDSGWKCGASGGVGANDPQDCDWPTCGCDPYATKVIQALEESGLLASAPAAPKPEGA